MKNQLILLVLCIIAVCLVSGNQKSNIAKLNSLIERTRKRLLKKVPPSAPPAVGPVGSKGGRGKPGGTDGNRRPGRPIGIYPLSFEVFRGTIRRVLQLYGLNFLEVRNFFLNFLRGASVELKKKNNINYNRPIPPSPVRRKGTNGPSGNKGAGGGFRPDTCYLIIKLQYKRFFHCRSRSRSCVIWRWVKTQIIRCY